MIDSPMDADQQMSIRERSLSAARSGPTTPRKLSEPAPGAFVDQGPENLPGGAGDSHPDRSHDVLECRQPLVDMAADQVLNRRATAQVQ